ncbi:tRNA lysidine(34) synthetase TilS [Bacteroidota bacterium]
MLKSFREYIEENSLCSTADKILVAVSGGIDSVVLLDLFHASGFETGLAHCNFHLRGEESDGDAAFVKSLAEGYAIEYYEKDFKTEQFAREKGISIQMAARDLRYQWFEEIRKKFHYELIATAHNQDDILETFFINLSRGTGIRGLSGIPVKAGKLIRPLLFASREKILGYAEKKGISFREDSSNTSDKYLRNKVRQQLIPMLEEQNPSFRKSLMETISKLLDTEKVFAEEMKRMKKSLLKYKGESASIRIADLEKLEYRKTVLYEILSDFNFGSASMEDIIHSLSGPSGKQFLSPTHRLVKDREDLILAPLKEDRDRKYYLELDMGQISEPIDLEWVIVDHTENFHIPKDPNVACLDLDLLDFPLILRHWKKGDYFHPFGMEGMKKMSDFLIDAKVSLPEKERVCLLASGQKIVWVVGHRIDDRFRITNHTKQVLLIRHTIKQDP